MEEASRSGSNGSAITAFLRTEKLQESEHVKSMQVLWRLGPSKRAIMFELTCLVAAAKPFVQATYQLEGDGPLSMIAYDVIERLSSIGTELLPDMVFPDIQKLAVGNSRIVAKKTGGKVNRHPPTAAAQVCFSNKYVTLATFEFHFK